MSDKGDNLPGTRPTSEEVQAFVDKARSMRRPDAGRGKAGARAERGRLVFAMDATASREPTWDRAMDTQAAMFQAAADLGGLDVQLVYYRGFGECRASRWVSDGQALLRAMTAVSCLGGRTQIGKVLGHALKQTKERKVAALVFVGDAMEEDIDDLCHRAGELGLHGVACFMFHEGRDPVAIRAFQQIARLSGGAAAPFDSASPDHLRRLLSAVAVYAAGGRAALEDLGRREGGEIRQLTDQMQQK